MPVTHFLAVENFKAKGTHHKKGESYRIDSLDADIFNFLLAKHLISVTVCESIDEDIPCHQTLASATGGEEIPPGISDKPKKKRKKKEES